MTQTEPFTFENWKIKFFSIWGGQAFSLLGSSLVQFALVWWLTQETGSATVLATATIVAMLPGIVAGPFVGALVDRWNRRVLMIVSDASIAVATLALIYIYWIGVMQPWHIYGIMLIRSLGGTFHWPAMQASTSLMVPKEHLSRVAGLNQTLQGLMSIAAPPLGALLVMAIPLHGVLAIDVFTMLLAVLPLVFVAIPQPQRTTMREAQAGTSVWQDMLAGFRYMWNWPGLMLVGGMAALINMLLSPTSALMPILVTQYFKGGALELGWIESAFGVGMVAGGILLSIWGGFKRRILTSLLGIAGIGVGCIVAGLSPANAFWLALSGMAISGAMNPIANGPLFAVLQDVVAPDMQGRVFTALNSLAMLMSPLGLALAGPLADVLGVQVWFIVGGVSCLVLGAGALLVPAIVHLEDNHHAQTAVAGKQALAKADGVVG